MTASSPQPNAHQQALFSALEKALAQRDYRTTPVAPQHRAHPDEYVAKLPLSDMVATTLWVGYDVGGRLTVRPFLPWEYYGSLREYLQRAYGDDLVFGDQISDLSSEQMTQALAEQTA